MRNLFFIAVFLFIHQGAAYSQGKILISTNFIIRNQDISTVDQGGYFLSDNFKQRITYGLGIESILTNRISISTGIQRTFFITDVNFWFLEPGNILIVKSDLITGLQIPVSVNYSLIKFDSKSRWRLGVTTGFSFNFMDKSSGSTSGGKKNTDRTREINFNSTFSPAKRSFITFDIGAFVKYRLTEKLWINYAYSYLQSFSEPIVVNNIMYSLTTTTRITDYVAQTVADGNARHHTIGLQFAF